MKNNPLVNNDSNAINDLSNMTLDRQTLYQPYLSAMTKNKVIDAVIETSNPTSVVGMWMEKGNSMALLVG
jgi:hypothetical protein